MRNTPSLLNQTLMCSGLIISLLLNLSMLTLILASSPAETLSDPQTPPQVQTLGLSRSYSV